jgi:hypothetical protein
MCYVKLRSAVLAHTKHPVTLDMYVLLSHVPVCVASISQAREV